MSFTSSTFRLLKLPKSLNITRFLLSITCTFSLRPASKGLHFFKCLLKPQGNINYTDFCSGVCLVLYRLTMFSMIRLEMTRNKVAL